jgi:hypothetical protein
LLKSVTSAGVDLEVEARGLFVESVSGWAALAFRIDRTGRSFTQAFVEAAVGGVFAGVLREW